MLLLLSRPVAFIPALLAITKATAMQPMPIRIPGTYPAMNRVEMDTPPATVEYTMKAEVGGIRSPVGADAMFAAALKAGS